PPSGCSVPGAGKPDVKGGCAACGAIARPVARQTLLFQLKHSELMTLKNTSFHFCANADCDVVYFGEDGTTYTKDHMRQKVGQKSTSPDRTICYCFDVTELDVREELANTGKSESKAFVMEQVKQKQCACEVRNPSGQCCLKDFPKG
ncbi:hypothetical protein MNBD_NITROSPINAE02-516, partial [hydrothermal vent metagenome]